jgi:hypothetical protein
MFLRYSESVKLGTWVVTPKVSIRLTYKGRHHADDSSHPGTGKLGFEWNSRITTWEEIVWVNLPYLKSTGTVTFLKVQRQSKLGVGRNPRYPMAPKRKDITDDSSAHQALEERLVLG